MDVQDKVRQGVGVVFLVAAVVFAVAAVMSLRWVVPLMMAAGACGLLGVACVDETGRAGR